jgi:hypothetical protein
VDEDPILGRSVQRLPCIGFFRGPKGLVIWIMIRNQESLTAAADDALAPSIKL